MSLTLKRKILAALCVACASAFAQTPAPATDGAGPANFAQHKQKELGRISLEMQALQTLQSCVQGAADHPAVKQCNETARAAMGRHRP